MMSAAQLREQFMKDLLYLQETCSHANISDWLEEWWGPGHGTGRDVKTCEFCEKVVAARRRCSGCGSRFSERELIEGDGRTLPGGGWYCADCRSAAGVVRN